MFDTEPEAKKVNNECKQFGSLHMFEEFVSHSNVLVCTLHKTRQVSNRYL